MKIDPSGVFFTAVCEIQTPVCRARQPSPLTAVWGTPRVQINVCTPCLNEMIRRGEWQVPGARIPKRYDMVVYSPPGQISVIVQVQANAPADPGEASTWARGVHRNLRMHAGIGAVPFFLLVGYPAHLFVWKGQSVLDPFVKPTDSFHDAAALQAHGFRGVAQASAAEQAVAAWLETLAKADGVPNDAAAQWMARTGILDVIRGGTVVRQPALAA